MATTKYLDYAGLQRYHGKLKTDIITPINNRIDEIVNVGGQPNVIEAVKINNNTFAIADKTASLAMNLTYDGTAKKIKLAIGSETQEIDATDFIKDGMLDNATYNAENKKLTLTFNTAAGKSAIDVDLTDLVDTYALSAGAATTGSYLTLTPGVSGTGSTSDPWKVTVALDETKLNEKIVNCINTIGPGETTPFAIRPENYNGPMSDVVISGLGASSLTKAATATYETLTSTNTGITFAELMQKFLANDIDLNTRLASVEGTVGGLGSAATKDETYFAKAAHTHTTAEVTNGTEIVYRADQVSIVTSLPDAWNVKSDLSKLLGNDRLLDTRLTSVEGQQVATIDMTTITGMTAAGEYENDALSSENSTTLKGTLDKAITYGTTIVLSYSLGGEFILYNIHRSGNMYSGSFYNSNSLFTDYSLTFSDEGTLMIKSANIASISNTEIDGLFA